MQTASHRVRGSSSALLLVGLTTIWSAVAVEAPCQTRQPRRAAPAASQQVRELSGLEALRYLSARRQYARAEDYAYRMLRKDIWQPEVLDTLVHTLLKERKKEEASAFNAILLRVFEEGAASAPLVVSLERRGEFVRGHGRGRAWRAGRLPLQLRKKIT